MKKILSIIALSVLSLSLQAQILKPVTWSYAAKKLNNAEAVLFLKATIDNGWHIYSANQKPGGPIKTSVTFTPGDYTMFGALTEPKPVTVFEKAFSMNVNYFEKSVVFQQKIKLKKGQTSVKGSIEYMSCNDKQCLPPEDIAFSIPVK